MKSVIVTLNVAIIAVAAAWIATRQSAVARGAFETNIPGVTIGDLPLERGFSYVFPDGALPIQSAQAAFGGPIGVLEGPVSPNIALVITGIRTANSTSAPVGILINGVPTYAGHPTSGDRAFPMQPILVRPGRFVRIEVPTFQGNSYSAAFTIQGYTIDANDLSLP